ncbi:Pentatricopeptide repeat [Macleaya cordata]|uniref:Pentatricopeptide repeat n=1 Tax=Macleaya cordata TaxID=56857 RepID=A0A200R534_MACCD|nr:Pentatricopeptide repeat [Macleaya cordata]
MRNLHTRTALFRYTHQKIPINNRSFQSSCESYANCIEKYGRDRALHSGRILHGYLIITGLVSSTYLSSKLISFYTQCGQISDARKVFERIPKTNLRRWIVLIGAYSRHGFYQETLDLFMEMQREGRKPNQYILPSILKACANLSVVQMGEKIHCVVLRSSSFDSDAFINCSLIYMYSKCGRLKNARNVFDRMLDKDLVAWNSMVSGYAQHGFARDAFNLVEKMKILGIKPNLVTWNALIAGFSQVGDSEMALELFKNMRVDGFEPDTVSWTSVISGFVQNFRNTEAFDTFKQMVGSGVRPSSFTISSLLPACATRADSKRGKEIHGYALVIGVEEDVFVSSSLVDMYAKCGFIFEAGKLFNKMHRKNTVTWNSMIFGYANHGYSNKAIELFNQMLEKDDVKPDHLTFTAALTACSHAGMVEVGQNMFHLMQEEHGIEPRLEHYACMVDLIGRAGELVEAYNFIKAMPIRPDFFVWGALLGACRNHGNIELAEIAAKQLFELEPENAGSCLLLSNLYADAGSWVDAERLKRMMKRKRLRRNLGCSWIQIA